jgi:hypothetical protein
MDAKRKHAYTKGLFILSEEGYIFVLKETVC